jgi:TonB family protein
MNKDLIRQVIQENRGSVLTCYDDVVRKTPGLQPQGEIAVRFVISRTGEVCAAQLARSTANILELEDCVVHAVASWRFPPPEGDGVLIVTYPFLFRAQAPPKDGG